LKNIIIDAQNYCSISLYRTMSNAERDGMPADSIIPSHRKLFYQMLKKLTRELGEFNNYFLVWDHPKGSAWRKEACEGYKGTRNHSVHLKEALAAGKEIAEELMIMNLEIQDAEADDVIHALCELLKTGNTVVSRDQDMIQIVQHGFAERVLDPVTRKDMVIPDYDIVLYKSICGDSSDNISGLRNHGPAKALKMLKEGLSPEQEAAIAPYKLVIDIPSNPQYGRILADVALAVGDFQ